MFCSFQCYSGLYGDLREFSNGIQEFCLFPCYSGLYGDLRGFLNEIYEFCLFPLGVCVCVLSLIHI